MRHAMGWSSLALTMMVIAAACGGDDDGTTGSGGSGTGTETGGSGGTGGAGTGTGTGTGTGMNTSGTCAAPEDLVLGMTVEGDTTGAMNALADSSCQAATDAEAVYTFTATETGTVALTLTSAPDLGIYVRTDCADPATEVNCTDVAFDMETVENMTLAVESGTQYFVVIDGYDTGQFGPYTLEAGMLATESSCNNMMDDNDNLFVDCEDVGCAADATCISDIAAACGAATPFTPGVAVNGDTATGGTNLFAGTCTGWGSPEHIYSYTPAVDQVMSIGFQSATDQGMHLRTDCTDSDTQLRCVDAQVGGTDELMRHAFLAGTTPHFLYVDGFMVGEEGPFSFTAEAANITESEPNDAFGMANLAVTGDVGYIATADEDWFSIVVAPPGNITITAGDVFAGDCAGSLIDTEIELFDTDGSTSLQFNDDIDEGNGNYCSAVTATGLAAGTYFVRVRGSQMFCPNCTMGYTLDIALN